MCLDCEPFFRARWLYFVACTDFVNVRNSVFGTSIVNGEIQHLLCVSPNRANVLPPRYLVTGEKFRSSLIS